MARFSDDFIRRVREANDIAQVVESYNIPLRRAGSNFVALCPFHDEKTPSFNVNPVEQFFKCFGCDEKGDVITFVQKMERVEFPEAVEMLASRAGLAPEYEEGQGPARDEGDTQSKKALIWANRKACEYFEAKLADVREGQAARSYLQARGFEPETLSTWRLGWAPDRWDGLLGHLIAAAGEPKRAKTIEAGLAAGVFRRNEDGGVYDAFRGRVMFPIQDMQGRVVGFGGRVLEAQATGAKYINTSEGRLFQKRKLLYGMRFAAKEIGLTNTAVVVEGYTDTIMCHQFGLRNVVATLGTSLTTEHVQRLRRYVQRGGYVLALFDADAAGERATERALRLFIQEDVPLRIVRALALKDACAFLPQFGADRFREELARAEDAFRYVLRRALEQRGDDVSQQAAAVETVMEVVNLSPNAVSRAMMRKEVAAAFKVPEEALPRPAPRSGVGRVAASRPGLQKEPIIRSALREPRTGRRRREMRLLQYMLESEAWCTRVVDVVPPDEFVDPACAELAVLIRNAWQSGGRPDADTLGRQCVGEHTPVVIADLTMPSHDLPFSDWELREALNRFQSEKWRQELSDLNEELRQEKNNSPRASELSRRKVELARRIANLKE